MTGDLFVDTNILVYAHDVDAGDKREKARALVAEMWRWDPLPWLSVQVLQELLVSLRRRHVPLPEVRELVDDYAQWRVVENTVSTLKAALAEMERWQLPFWDALILAAARIAGASRLWSEDFNDGQDYGGIRAANPLLTPGA